jgi:hypothetical protein
MKNRGSQTRTTAILRAIENGSERTGYYEAPKQRAFLVQISIGSPKAVRVANFRLAFHDKQD